MAQRCCNPCCGKELGEGDAPRHSGPPFFFPKHLCHRCWEKFHLQKMGGRFRAAGLSHEDFVRLVERKTQGLLPGGCSLIGLPPEWGRYTESVDEWIAWQKPPEAPDGN